MKWSRIYFAGELATAVIQPCCKTCAVIQIHVHRMRLDLFLGLSTPLYHPSRSYLLRIYTYNVTEELLSLPSSLFDRRNVIVNRFTYDLTLNEHQHLRTTHMYLDQQTFMVLLTLMRVFFRKMLVTITPIRRRPSQVYPQTFIISYCIE